MIKKLLLVVSAAAILLIGAPQSAQADEPAPEPRCNPIANTCW